MEEDNMDVITAPSTSFYAVSIFLLINIQTGTSHLN